LKTSEVLHAWGRILSGRRPSLSIEITRECPLRCPGCYAYGDNHLGTGEITKLKQLSDFKGDELVTRVLGVVDEYKPLHLSIVGGDPLVRYRELETLLPQIIDRGVHIQLVTSAFREVPVEWGTWPKLCIVVSIDGLPAEHDERRKPATYERIHKSLAGHHNSISVHCTVTSQLARRPGYLREFTEYWSVRPETKRIWFSLYTPQRGEVAEEILSPELRASTVAEILALRKEFPKIDMAEGAVKHFLKPPQSPQECTFAQTTHTVSADLRTNITPCQFGGDPDCSQCGCIASVGLAALSSHRLPGGIRVGAIFDASNAIGNAVARARNLPGARPASPEPEPPLKVLPGKTARAS
jgi:organic radical activating enzyme